MQFFDQVCSDVNSEFVTVLIKISQSLTTIKRIGEQGRDETWRDVPKRSIQLYSKAAHCPRKAGLEKL